MADISVKVSEITVEDIADYVRLSDLSEEDTNFLKKCLEIAKSYIKNYTGVEDLDSQAEFVICIYVICEDLYDNRSYYIDSKVLNRSDYHNSIVSTILDMHNRNLI